MTTKIKNIFIRLLGKKIICYTWDKKNLQVMLECIMYYYHKKYYIWKIINRIPLCKKQNRILFGDTE